MALKAEQGKYISKRTETIEEMEQWLNGVMEKYPGYEKPYLSSDLCRCIIHVWDVLD